MTSPENLLAERNTQAFCKGILGAFSPDIEFSIMYDHAADRIWVTLEWSLEGVRCDIDCMTIRHEQSEFHWVLGKVLRQGVSSIYRARWARLHPEHSNLDGWLMASRARQHEAWRGSEVDTGQIDFNIGLVSIEAMHPGLPTIDIGSTDKFLTDDEPPKYTPPPSPEEWGTW